MYIVCTHLYTHVGTNHTKLNVLWVYPFSEKARGADMGIDKAYLLSCLPYTPFNTSKCYFKTKWYFRSSKKKAPQKEQRKNQFTIARRKKNVNDKSGKIFFLLNHGEHPSEDTTFSPER